MRKNESGQALVLILLSLAVVLTLVLFILSRSVTDVAVSSRQEESVRAFSAAEAGIERSLVIGTGFSSAQLIGNASYTTAVSEFALGTTDVSFPSPVSSGDTVTVWFTSHALDGSLSCSSGPCFHGDTIKVCWGNPDTAAGDATTPAVEVSVFYETTPGDLSTINIGREAVDPNAARRATNAFAAPDAGACTIGTQTYEFQKTITFASLGIPAGSYNFDNGLQIAKIRLLYNSGIPHLVGASVSGGNTLPSQGQRIDSSGVAGGSNRRIVVYQGWGEDPYSSNSLMVPAGITQ
jgi:Tfp pilus assembly protein PilX